MLQRVVPTLADRVLGSGIFQVYAMTGKTGLDAHLVFQKRLSTND